MYLNLQKTPEDSVIGFKLHSKNSILKTFGCLFFAMAAKDGLLYVAGVTVREGKVTRISSKKLCMMFFVESNLNRG